MTARLIPWIAALVAVAIAVTFAMVARLPLPFEGFAAIVAGVLAALLTFSLTLFLPPAWVWTDTERLVHAFEERHNLSGVRASSALEAIATAHRRASVIREAAPKFQAPLDAQALRAADLLDGVAREIFYDPKTFNTHRSNLIRSELVEDAVKTHAALRDRGERSSTGAQVQASRESVTTALTSLEDAFAQAEARVADQLLTEVVTASTTAETLLAPRRAAQHSKDMNKDTP